MPTLTFVFLSDDKSPDEGNVSESEFENLPYFENHFQAEEFIVHNLPKRSVNDLRFNLSSNVIENSPKKPDKSGQMSGWNSRRFGG